LRSLRLPIWGVRESRVISMDNESPSKDSGTSWPGGMMVEMGAINNEHRRMVEAKLLTVCM
jgi:hypothetical protein